MQAYKSKVDIIYENILDGIGQGLYKPGERLVISQLAKENATSEIPVREAVRRLESEGFIDMQANKSPYVKGFDPEKAINIFRMKGVLEGYATRLAIDYLTPLDIRHLQEINDEMRACEPTGKKHGDLNMQFHLAIYDKIPQREWYDMISDLWKKWGITRSVFAMEVDLIPGSIQDHDRIIQLLSEKDYDGVEQCVRAHKERAGAVMSEHLRKGK